MGVFPATANFVEISAGRLLFSYFETFCSPTRVMYFAAGLVEGGTSSGGCACIGAAVCF
jgi:hypothetical protein